MFIQVGIWGSKELLTAVRERAYPSNWLAGLDNKTISEIQALHPVSIHKNCDSQQGSIMPKIIRYYDLANNSPFKNKTSLDLGPYERRMETKLEGYMDDSIFGNPRFLEHDDIAVYPYLSQDNELYFSTHNIKSLYATEDLLKLIHQQLKNFNSDHCYMTQIRGYYPEFDICYQSISVKNHEKLDIEGIDQTCEIKQSWFGQHTYGYPVERLINEFGSDIENSLKPLTRDDVASPTQVYDLIRLATGIDTNCLSQIELEHHIKWCEAFSPNDVSFMYDLLGICSGQNYTITHSTEVDFLDFDWESLESS